MSYCRSPIYAFKTWEDTYVCYNCQGPGPDPSNATEEELRAHGFQTLRDFKLHMETHRHLGGDVIVALDQIDREIAEAEMTYCWSPIYAFKSVEGTYVCYDCLGSGPHPSGATKEELRAHGFKTLRDFKLHMETHRHFGGDVIAALDQIDKEIAEEEGR